MSGVGCREGCLIADCGLRIAERIGRRAIGILAVGGSWAKRGVAVEREIAEGAEAKRCGETEQLLGRSWIRFVI